MIIVFACAALASTSSLVDLRSYLGGGESTLRTWFPVTNFNIAIKGRVHRRLLPSDTDDIPEELQLTFTGRNNKSYSFHLTRASVFDEESIYVVNDENGVTHNSTEPPPVPVYETKMHDGVWAQANILDDGSVSTLIRDKEDLFIVEPAGHHTLVAQDTGGVDPAHVMEAGAMVQYDVTAEGGDLWGIEDADDDFDDIVLPDGTDLGALMRGNVSLPDRASKGRRLSQLNTLPTKPYGRLSGCEPKPKLRKLKMGVIADRGFTKRAGGTASKALSKITNIVSRANAIYEEQAGIRIVLVRTIINVGTGYFRDTGPNYRPSKSGRNKCGTFAKDFSTFTTRKGSPSSSNWAKVVYRKGHIALLNKMSSWVANHGGTAADTWHLFTNCFPAPGVVGAAWSRSACDEGRELFVRNTGEPCKKCNYKMPDGKKGKLYLGRSGCPQHNGKWSCYAPVAITSWISNTWRMFVHEVRAGATGVESSRDDGPDLSPCPAPPQLAHNVGAPHTTGKGGVMDNMNYEQFYDDGRLCQSLNDLKAKGCLPQM